MKQKIAVLGAFDRFNYGDLLFPLVIEKALIDKGCNSCQFDYYAMCESDLRTFGGKPTHSLQKLFDPSSLPDGSAVIVAGGEVLGATWFKLHRYILSQKYSFLLRACNKLVDTYILDNISRNAFHSKLPAPFIVSPGDFPHSVKVLYNAVGGSSLKACNDSHRNRVITSLKDADYLSVRDEETKKLLENSLPDREIILTPDSAIVMSNYFPCHVLETMISRETKDIIEMFPKGYICFQSADDHAREDILLIVHELEKIHKRYQLGIVLLPIGRASGHEDQIPLGKIQDRITTPAVMPKENSVFDIMFLIAKSKLYAGTSLHGAITALSFAVPHAGLTDKVPKLEAFLNTWSVPGLQSCIPYHVLAQKIKDYFDVPKDALEACRDRLISLSMEHFSTMSNIIQKDNDRNIS